MLRLLPSVILFVPLSLNPCSPRKSSQHQAHATSPGTSFLLLQVLWHGSSDHIWGNCPVLPVILDQWHSSAPCVPTAGTQFLPFFLWLNFCTICSALPPTQPLQRGFLVTWLCHLKINLFFSTLPLLGGFLHLLVGVCVFLWVPASPFWLFLENRKMFPVSRSKTSKAGIPRNSLKV